jgi:hypothetical protein
MRELKRLVDSGALGDILHVEGHYCNEHSTRVSGGWRDDPNESPGAGMTGACTCSMRSSIWPVRSPVSTLACIVRDLRPIRVMRWRSRCNSRRVRRA